MLRKISKFYMDRDTLYRQHILDAAGTIEGFISGKTFEDFSSSKLLQDAVLHEVQIIGEAAKRLSNEFKDKYDVPWRKIVATRDKLVHDYFKVDLIVIWDTAKDDVPILKQKLQSD